MIMELMTSDSHRIFQDLDTLSETVRGRMLLLLEGSELTVSELRSILQAPQSTVSRHLKVLADGGWVVSRAEGTHRHYRLSDKMSASQDALWGVVRESARGVAEGVQDQERSRAVLHARRRRSEEFFSQSAENWDSLRDTLFGAYTSRLPLFGLLDPRWTVADLGCGTGHFCEAAAPFVQCLIGVDASEAMLGAATERLRDEPTVDLRRGTLEALPIEDQSCDLAVMLLVLHYVTHPVDALTEAARILRPGGRLVIVDMRTHERAEYRETMGHLWQGFSQDQLSGWTSEAGLTGLEVRPLSAELEASGPLLFVGTAHRAIEETQLMLHT